MKYKYTNSPYKDIPKELLDEYTMGGKIPIKDFWFDSKSALAQSDWNQEYVDSFKNRFTPEKIKSNQQGREPYGGAARLLLHAFEKYNLINKNVAVIGSATPWIESILMNLGNKTTTIEYNVPEVSCYGMKSNSYESFLQDDETYDYIVTFSSIEHAGLGRYGDPLSPNEDIEAMRSIHRKLSNDGLLVWGAPVGTDRICWNAHRIYGRIRLPLMFKGFEEIDWIGADKEVLFRYDEFQPVVVLKKKNDDKN
jgi:hypothetical protein